MKFELHCHSWYSKGSKIPWEGLASPRQIVRYAKKLKLTGIALTDHDTNKGWLQTKKEAKKQGIIFIPGIEVSTNAGHLTGLGVNEAIKPKQSLEETMDAIHEQGGLAIAPHPFDIKRDGIGNNIKLVDVVEVFNAMNLTKLDDMFAEKKATQLNKPKVAGSDAHTLDMIGMAMNIIEAGDVDSVLENIRKGKVKLEKKYIPLKIIVKWTRERMIRSYADILKYINTNYSPPKAWVAKILLNKFIHSDSITWDMLAVLGANLARIYSYFRILSYY